MSQGNVIDRANYREIEFGVNGDPVGPVVDLFDTGTTDVLVFAHGWNNDASAARDRYERWAAGVTAGLADGADVPTTPIRLGFLGVLWPSQEFDLPPADPAQRAAALTVALDRLDGLSSADHARVDVARAVVPELEVSSRARSSFVEALGGVLVTADDDRGDGLVAAPPDEHVLADLSRAGPGPGVGAGLGDVLTGAINLANLTTFWTMKERAGVVGERGLAPVLADLAGRGLRLHLVGHSFGARLVSAAALAAHRQAPGASAASIALLQGAFSHYAFATAWDGNHDGNHDGLYRDVLTTGGLAGPMIVTHTHNDVPVTLAYALASRLRHQIGSLPGHRDDPYGGLGANGAQATPQVSTDETWLRPVGEQYTLAPGAVHNLQADKFVRDHGDVGGPEVAAALTAAVRTGARQ